MIKRNLTIYIIIALLFGGLAGTSLKANSFSDYTIENEKKEFKIYPNPAKTFIKINFEEDYTTDFKIRIFDLLGKEHTIKIEEEETRLIYIGLDNFSSGFYFVEVVFPDKRRLVKKFMIKDS